MIAAGLVLLTASVPAHACGPYFPPRILENRADALLSTPEGTFWREVSQLAMPAVALPQEIDGGADAQRARGLEPGELAILAQVRAARSLPEARKRAQGLQTELRLYALGAWAFHSGEPDRGRALFEALVALPTAERPLRGTWARYMLGILSAPWEAQAHFSTLRAEVARGAADPMGLAVASLGEQARALKELDPSAAIDLYAEQAALGSGVGRRSLLFMARRLVEESDDEQLAAWIVEPRVRRLLVVYVWSRPLDTAAYGGRALAPEQLIGAIERAGITDVAYADRMAALAYEAGNYPLAARYVSRSHTPLSRWVDAKLALRDGDLDKAAAAYADAAAAFPADEVWTVAFEGAWDWTSWQVMPVQQRVFAEQGALQLARGDYVDALRILLRAVEAPEPGSWFVGRGQRGWEDAAHVAERVLTVDELRTFVDHESPEIRADLREGIRALLARRLIRSGRAAEAVRYFDDPELAATATAYAAALARTTRGDAISRAEAWLEAGEIARPALRLLGTEGSPDYVVYEGSYGRGQSADDLGGLDRGTYCSAEEQSRVRASAPTPELRFHYRQIAADHAEAAADALPTDSQAFAVALCRAASYLIDRDPTERVPALYRRYIEEGPLYEGSGSFGQVCPEPDFAGLRARQQIAAARRGRTLLVGLLLAAMGLAWMWTGWRSARREATAP